MSLNKATPQISASNQASRAEKTRIQLIQAAESLMVEKGPENVTVRDIVRGAGQKNESALQYHFKNRDGLIIALQSQRIKQLDERRSALIAEALLIYPEPDIRTTCAILVQAPFLLCREDRDFRQYLGVFGQRLIASGLAVSQVLSKQRSSSLTQLYKILRVSLGQLDNDLFHFRLEAMSSLVLLSLSRRASDGGSFRGKRAELFISNLTDLMVAILSAPVSAATNELIASK
jgi:AcrR family transcriptional regulator